eukprot:m.437758 g.437758  ORF g.437758 m.437758 type:complete len:439 (+) comp20273_c1_seq36:4204-5520(+)
MSPLSDCNMMVELWHDKFATNMATPQSPQVRRLSRSGRTARELPRDTVALTTLVRGVGNFGFYRGSCDFTTRKAGAVKTAKLPVGIKLVRKGAPAEDQQALLNEAKYMAQFAHPNVLAVGGVVSASEPRMIVHELVLGSLADYLPGRTVEVGLLRKFALEVCNGLTYLGRHAFVHWDVACRNIFLDSHQLCKIGNLGLEKTSTDPAPKGFYTNPLGKRVMRWSAPEYVDTEASARRNTTQEDVWCFGFFLYELMTQGRIPYGGENTWPDVRLFESTMAEIYRGCLLPEPEGCPKDIYDVMVQCWALDPKNRPSFQRIKTILTSQSAMDELDFILGQATELAIAEGKDHSGVRLTREEAEGISRPPSPLDEGTRMLIQENAPLREERDRRSKETPLNAPSSPRPPRKFKPSGFEERSRSKTPINPEVVQRFTHMFAEPS